MILELLIWGARHETSSESSALILKMVGKRNAILVEVRKRWQKRDSTPLQTKSGEWLWPNY